MTDPTSELPPIGYCQCGCGTKTGLAPRNRAERGIVKGQPSRYIPKHAVRSRSTSRELVDRKFGKIAESIVPEDLRSKDEVWLPVVGYEGFYEVSNRGQVRRLASRIRCKNGSIKTVLGKILAQHENKQGYRRLPLCRDGVSKNHSVHRLVCEAFHGGAPNPELQVRHLNATPHDNRPENLAWGTPAENSMDTIVLGRNYQLGKTHCIRGHKFTDENTYVKKNGTRQCRTCHRQREAARQKR